LGLAISQAIVNLFCRAQALALFCNALPCAGVPGVVLKAKDVPTQKTNLTSKAGANITVWRQGKDVYVKVRKRSCTYRIVFRKVVSHVPLALLFAL
jgi:hypothetical protein